LGKRKAASVQKKKRGQKRREKLVRQTVAVSSAADQSDAETTFAVFLNKKGGALFTSYFW